MNQKAQSWDPIWEEIYQSQEWGKYPPEYLIRFIARRFYHLKDSDRNNVQILDLGCGTGACSWYIAREGFSVSGIDGSTSAVERASNRLKGEGLSADLKVGDYMSLPWPDNHFDAVVDNVTLYCNRFKECKVAVNEVRRVLKQDGAFLSANFSDRTWGYGAGTEVEPSGFKDISEGPLTGRGFALFLSRSHLDELYRDFKRTSIERLSWTMESMTKEVELWIVTCTK
jgi:ubiquinone/menaquinone biosynthesis C-methylase UbiE